MLVWCIQTPSPSWGSLKVSAVSSQKDQDIDAQTEEKYVMSSSIIHESVKDSKQTFIFVTCWFWQPRHPTSHRRPRIYQPTDLYWDSGRFSQISVQLDVIEEMQEYVVMYLCLCSAIHTRLFFWRYGAVVVWSRGRTLSQSLTTLCQPQRRAVLMEAYILTTKLYEHVYDSVLFLSIIINTLDTLG